MWPDFCIGSEKLEQGLSQKLLPAHLVHSSSWTTLWYLNERGSAMVGGYSGEALVVQRRGRVGELLQKEVTEMGH